MMKDNNYLWDRSGEPDPEIQKLEEVLGALRYQPRPLEIPANINIGRRRTFFPALAIAAAIALVTVALGIWFGFTRSSTPQSLQVNAGSQIDQQLPPAAPDSPPAKEAPALDVKSPRRNLVAVNRNPVRRVEIRQPELTPQELAEKEQVLLALRLVSAKLNVAQRKAQGVPPLNVIRNHRIG